MELVVVILVSVALVLVGYLQMRHARAIIDFLIPSYPEEVKLGNVRIAQLIGLSFVGVGLFIAARYSYLVFVKWVLE